MRWAGNDCLRRRFDESNRAYPAVARLAVGCCDQDEGSSRTIYPRQCRFQRSVMTLQQGLALERDRFIRYDSHPLQASAVCGDEITRGVNQDIAVRQLVEVGRQRLPHRRLAEDAGAAERLHASGKAFRRAAGQPVDEYGNGTAEGLDALAFG